MSASQNAVKIQVRAMDVDGLGLVTCVESQSVQHDVAHESAKFKSPILGFALSVGPVGSSHRPLAAEVSADAFCCKKCKILKCFDIFL